MTSTDTAGSADHASLRTAAAHNNAAWCAAVCRTHGIPVVFGDTAWWSTHRAPMYYPDAITLRADATAADFLPGIDSLSTGGSVKDSFATLDLTPYGFVELFEAEWIHRPAALPEPRAVAPAPALRTSDVTTAAQLRNWQVAWHGDDGEAAPDVFRPGLLADPAVRILAVRAPRTGRAGTGSARRPSDNEPLAGGVVLNLGAGHVGLSNIFAVDGEDIGAIWAAAVAAAAEAFPGIDIVGYETADDLAPAVAAGFTARGPLRIWLHT